MDGNMKVYYADDDADDIDLFMSVMEDMGVKATSFYGAEKLLETLQADIDLPNLIFLDLNMPRRHGFEVLEDLRNNDRLKDIPVVIYSTSAHPLVVERAKEHGARHYIRKGNSFREITLALKYALAFDWSGSASPINFLHQNDSLQR